MPESSGESSSPSQNQPDPSRRAALPGMPEPLAPAPRVIHPGGHPAREPQAKTSAPSLPPGLNEALEWIRRQADEDAVPGNPPGNSNRGRPPSRSLLSKEQRKFHKFDPEHPEAKSAGPEKSDPSIASEPRLRPADDEETMPVPGIPPGITSEELALLRRLRRDAADPNPWYVIGIAAFAFLLVVVAFLAGHGNLLRTFGLDRPGELAAQDSTHGGLVPRVLPIGTLTLIDESITAETEKNYPKAIGLLDQAQREAGHIDGLDYRLAALCYKASDRTRAESLLNRSITEGEEVAACSSLRGVLANGEGSTAQGMNDLETATRLDPFNASYPFLWGEALRRAGEPRRAIVQLQRAVERAQEPALAEVYAMKVRLTQIEQGQADVFAEEMAAQLKSSPPPVPWLLTAAALEMHRDNFPAATEYLLRIRVFVGERETQRLLQDIYFKNFAREKELATFFASPASNAPSASP